MNTLCQIKTQTAELGAYLTGRDEKLFIKSHIPHPGFETRMKRPHIQTTAHEPRWSNPVATPSAAQTAKLGAKPWDPIPETQNSKPGIPETRNPKPETRKPKTRKPETRNPKPDTRHQKPETRNPTPDTRNPKPETRHLKIKNRNLKPET
jgi:hypothetical protein